MYSKKLLQGSSWYKWDLHIHTPSSIVQNYGSDNEVVWESFISDIENLPKEFKVIGINDYLFLDGYKKVLKYKREGRLQNIDLILPVLEFRIDSFAGTDQKHSRINIHVIFSNDLDPDVIEAQFLSALNKGYHLDPESGGHTWSGVLNRRSLAEFGKSIKASSPDGKAPLESDIIVGFNNLCLSTGVFFDCLTSNTFLRGKYITALGKTEWDALKWTGSSAGTKKDLINRVDFVFTSSESKENLAKAIHSLSSSGVNSRLLDCSDAHQLSNSGLKDRIGKCFTWIKGDLTFDALKYARIEYPQRVFLGDKPEKLTLVENNKTKFLKNVEIKKIEGSSLDEVWFNSSIPLSPDLVAVIGNKGNGKSAFLEILALAGNCKEDSNFLFLSTQKFRRKPDKSSHFEVTITTEDGKTRTKRLSDPSDPNDVQLVKFLPQHLLDKLCNDIAKTENSDFDKELKDIIFSHVPVDERSGMNNLDDLIDLKTSEVTIEVENLRSQLHKINKDIIQLEDQRLDSYRQQLVSQISQKKAELDAHDSVKPKEIAKPNQDGDQEVLKKVEDLERNITEVEGKIKEISKNKVDLGLKLDKIKIVEGKLKLIESQLKLIELDFDAILESSEQAKSILSFQINYNVLNTLKNKIEIEIESIDFLLDESNLKSLITLLKNLNNELNELKKKCDEPNRIYQKYLYELKIWEKTRNSIIGDKDTFGSIVYLEYAIEEQGRICGRIQEKVHERLSIVRLIFGKISELSSNLKNLYNPVQQFASQHPIITGKLNLIFDVSITYSTFIDKFLDSIDKSSGGSFHGTEESVSKVKDYLESISFQDIDGLILFLESIQKELYVDKKGGQISVSKQLKKSVKTLEFYDFLYGLEYLIPKYTMKLGDKELSQLSPGEKGTLLLIFYLLVDLRDVPLLIDQPEDNLDNHTVFDLLVPSIKEAKKRRQIILVTHNPNLAVVCDAEQVIAAELDKLNSNQVKYTSGAIENPVIRDCIVNILEGTKPAFNNRETKYKGVG